MTPNVPWLSINKNIGLASKYYLNGLIQTYFIWRNIVLESWKFSPYFVLTVDPKGKSFLSETNLKSIPPLLRLL